MRSSQSTPETGSRRPRRWLFAVAVLVPIALVAAALVLVVLAGRSPAWANAPLPADAATAAERLENAAATQLTAPRPTDPAADPARWTSTPWEVSLQESDVNAWLAHRLPMWLEHRGMAAQGDSPHVVVSLEDGLVRVATQVRQGNDVRTLSADCVPRVDASGALWLDVRAVYLGSLRVPRSLLSGSGTPLPATGETRRVLDALDGEAPLVSPAVIDLEDGRRVRILSLTPVQDRLDVRCVTETRQ